MATDQYRATVREPGALAALPVVGAALLPKLVCAACWPAYTAALGSLGIGFVNYTPYLLPLTIAGLAIAVGSLAFLARRRHRIEPLLLGLAAASAVFAGKFVIDANWAVYMGVGLLMVASLFPWRPRPRAAATPGDCCKT